jgi:hypothetical protein
MGLLLMITTALNEYCIHGSIKLRSYVPYKTTLKARKNCITKVRQIDQQQHNEIFKLAATLCIICACDSKAHSIKIAFSLLNPVTHENHPHHRTCPGKPLSIY